MSNFIQRIRIFSKKRYYLLTGFLFFLSFPSFDIFFLKAFPLFAWFCLVPLFVYIRNKPLKQVYITVLQTFLLGAILSFGWMRAFGSTTVSGQIIILLFLIPALATFFSGRIFIAEFLSRKNERLRFFIFPAVCVFFDFIQSVGYLAFPWTYLGYTQYPFTQIIQIASLFGVFGVTFLVVSSNTAISMFLYDKTSDERILNIQSFLPLIAAFTLFAVSLCFGIIRLNRPEAEGHNHKMALVQSCISPWENWEQYKFRYLEELITLSDKALLEKPEMLIWSESATLETISFRINKGIKNPFDDRIRNYAIFNNIPLLTGEIGLGEKKGYLYYFPKNNVSLIDSQGNIANTYSKIHLAPFGEFFPYDKIMPWVSDLALSMGGSIFLPGDKTPLFHFGELRFGNLICYESMFFRLNREYSQKGVDFLVNITNDGWSKSYGGHFQHFSAAPFRAIETGVPFVRVGNTGNTTIIDSKGRYRNYLQILKKGYVIADINTGNNVKTVYTRIGDFFVYVLIVFLSILSLILIFKTVKNRRRQK